MHPCVSYCQHAILLPFQLLSVLFSDAALDASGLDLNLLLEEIRQLRIQMTRAIDNNNRLRRSLEQNLANQRAQKQQQQHVTNGDVSDSSVPMTREEMRSSSRNTDVELPRKLHRCSLKKIRPCLLTQTV